MSTIIAELYDALREAGVSDEKARAAAAAVIGAESEAGFATKGDIALLKGDIGSLHSYMAAMESRLEARMAATESRLEARMAAMESRILKWNLATILSAMTLIIAAAAALKLTH